MVNFVFFGLPDLDQVLSLDEPLKQRVAIRIKLNAYSEADTKDYIRHRLKVADADKEIFTDKAISMIYKYSNGIPRLINTICDNALLEGFLFKNSTVDDSIIKTVAIDLGLEN
jgi:type II secretory pathway predicted ATPase ExeA